MSRWMYGAMAVGLVWSAINVGTNYGRTFGPGGPRLAFWIVSFGVEAMVSIPILQIMDQATTAARIGQRVDRAKIIAFEVSLLVVTVGLNAGPHLQAGDALGVVLYSAAPVMVVVGLWLHTWLATRYARMIEGLSVPAAGAADRKSSRTGDQPSNVSTSNARDIPALSGVFAPRERSLDACERVARQMIAQRSAKVPEDHLVAVLRLAQAGWNANAIAVEMRRITAASIYRSTIDRHILCAKSMGLEIPVLESTATT
ncbi:hypothetical protein ACIBG0_34970 [Nocardia sp. NPDC050630]|uniref:hypothetical protein n=1 Tax=Nocardia sp. NPDC050630 TaxID=3364321 RepID=UPI0037B9EE8E